MDSERHNLHGAHTLKWLRLDFETYCDVDIKKVGAYKYASDPSCEVLLAGFSYRDGKTQIWDALSRRAMPANLRKYLLDSKVIIYAFNASFERLILKYVLDINIPIERFRCTQAHAYHLSFTGGLAEVGSQIGIEKAKLTEGKELITFFCKPRKPTKNKTWTRNLPVHDPEKWEAFKGYCIRDVEAEAEVSNFLEDYPMPDEEWEAWFMDQRINDRGIPLDMDLIYAALEVGEKERTKVLGQIKRITGIENPNSLPQLKTWFLEQNCDIPNMQGDTLEEWHSVTKGNIKKIIGLYLRIAKSSYSKYSTMLMCEIDGRVHGTLQFAGATRTNRWAGRLIQPQNFIRPPKGFKASKSIELIKSHKVPQPVMTHLAAALRGAICAPSKLNMPIADLAGIEGRVLPWLCFFDSKLDKIRAGMDMYLVAAAEIYDIPYEELNEDSPERFGGKVAELALGYQGAVGALNSMCLSLGMEEFEENRALEIVRGWRRANYTIKQFWYDTEDAAKEALYYEDHLTTVGRLKFYAEGEFLFMILPGGRRIGYHLPAIDDADTLSYMGWNSFKRRWERIDTYGGKLVENATQATARDILVHGMKLAESRGFKIVGSVHDEILTCQRPLKKFNHEALIHCMTNLPKWAQGLPLNAAGYTEQRYRK